MTRCIGAGVAFAPVTGVRSECGESPVWDAGSGCLTYVDINGRAIHRVSVADSAARSWDSEDFPTAIALRRSGGAVLAHASGVSLFDFETGGVERLCAPDPMPGNRLNEGKCDPAGRFWVGSMQSNLNPDGSGRDMDRHSGALFRVDPDGAVSCHSEREFGVSNTMAWSPDKRTFYFGDSLRNVIFAYDYDDDAGTLCNRRVLLEGYPHGVPDGSCIDADGCLWNTRFGGARVIRIAPDGSVDAEIGLPVSNPTCCAFGGPDMRTLFVTSARFGLSGNDLDSNPLEGALLRADLPHGGLPGDEFRG